MSTHSSIPWTEEPGGLPSMELQRVEHYWSCETTTTTNHFIFCGHTIWSLSQLLFFYHCKREAASHYKWVWLYSKDLALGQNFLCYIFIYTSLKYFINSIVIPSLTYIFRNRCVISKCFEVFQVILLISNSYGIREHTVYDLKLFLLFVSSVQHYNPHLYISQNDHYHKTSYHLSPFSWPL